MDINTVTAEQIRQAFPSPQASGSRGENTHCYCVGGAVIMYLTATPLEEVNGGLTRFPLTTTVLERVFKQLGLHARAHKLDFMPQEVSQNPASTTPVDIDRDHLSYMQNVVGHIIGANEAGDFEESWRAVDDFLTALRAAVYYLENEEYKSL